jgi:hypothetical protein
VDVLRPGRDCIAERLELVAVAALAICPLAASNLRAVDPDPAARLWMIWPRHPHPCPRTDDLETEREETGIGPPSALQMMSVAHDARGRGYGGADSHGKRWAKCGHGMNLRRSGSLPALPVLPQSSSIRSAATNAPLKEIPGQPVPTIEQERERSKKNEPDRNLLRSRSIRLKMAVTVGFELTSSGIS